MKPSERIKNIYRQERLKRKEDGEDLGTWEEMMINSIFQYLDKEHEKKKCQHGPEGRCNKCFN